MDKKILKNYLYDMIREFVLVFLPLITVPYISRVLSAEELGIYSYSLNIVSYFTISAELGFQYLGRREISKAKTKDERDEIFLKILTLKVLFGLLINVIYFLVIPRVMDYPLVYVIQGFNLIAVVFEISWYYAGIEEFKKITLRSIIYKAISVFLLFTYVRGENVLLKYVLCMGLPNLFGNLFMFYKIGIKIRIPKLKFVEIKEYLLGATVLLIPTLLKSLYTIIDKTMLGGLSTMQEVGYYAQTFRFVDVLITVVYSIGTVSFARLIASYHNGELEKVKSLMSEIVTFVIHLGFPVMLGLASISDVFVPWFFGDEYLVLSKLLPLSAPLIMITALNNIFCRQFLIAANKEDVLVKYTFIGVIINLLFDALLIPGYGAAGAIAASIVSETVIVTLSVVYYKRTIPGVILKFENYKCLISATFMYGVVMYVKDILEGQIIFKIAVCVFLGIASYFAMEVLLKDSWIIKFIKVIRGKMHAE